MNDLELRLRDALDEEAANFQPALPPLSRVIGRRRRLPAPSARWAVGLTVAATRPAVLAVAAVPGLLRSESRSSGALAHGAATAGPEGPPQAGLPSFTQDSAPAGLVDVAARITTSHGVREIITYRTADGTFCWALIGQPRTSSTFSGNNQLGLIAQADYADALTPGTTGRADVAFGLAPAGSAAVVLSDQDATVRVPTVTAAAGGGTYTFFLQFGHLVRASSLKDWTMSNWWSQSLHLYS